MTRMCNTNAGIHRRNVAEGAIQTFKDHFIAGICTTDLDFPLHLWDKLLDQALLTLNMLRGSRINPKLSAYAQIHSHYDYHAHPIAPPGIHVVIHDKPDKRGTWATQGTGGWYVGPAMHHYRRFDVWDWYTQAMRIADTLSWFPAIHTMPVASTGDIIQTSLRDIVDAMHKPNTNSPPTNIRIMDIRY